jgi:PAS domain S-box-containing protein
MRGLLWRKWTIERVFALGFIGLSLLAAPSAYLVLQGFSVAQAERALIRDASEISHQAHAVLTASQDAVIGTQAFVIIGDPAFFVAYRRARTELATATTQLHALVTDDPAQQQRLAQLDALIDEQQRHLAAMIERGPSVAGVAMAADMSASSALVRAVEGTVADIVNAEQQRITRTDTAVARRVANNRLIIDSSFVSAALATLMGGLLAIRYVGRLKKSDARLADGAALLRATLESIDQGVVVVDRNLRMKAWNDRFLALNDYPRELAYRDAPYAEFLRRLAARGQFGRSDTDIAEVIAQIRGGAAHRFERERPNGVFIEICGNYTPDGLLVTTFRDITARKRVEMQLQGSAARLRAIFDSAIDAIFTIGANGTIEGLNNAAERLFGYRADEVVRGDIRRVMPEFYPSVEPCTPVGRREIVVHRRDGTAIPVEATISEFALEGNRLFVAILRDISERKQVDRMKTEFVTTVSHELRTPLTSIAGSLGLLAASAAGDLPEVPRRLIHIAHANCERLVRLVNDILDLEKIESGKMEFAFQPIRLRGLVESGIEANRAYAERLGVTLALDPHAEDGIVQADSDRMIQVVTNLLSNAAKFSKSGGTVDISLVRRSNTLRLSILDHGRGIDPAFRDRIFERFAQARGSGGQGRGGTGLGLAICRQIVESHGGQISFDSVFGEWTVFHVDLPLIGAETQIAGIPDTQKIALDAVPGGGAEVLAHT